MPEDQIQSSLEIGAVSLGGAAANPAAEHRSSFPGTGLPSVALLTDSDIFAGTERHIMDLAKELTNLGVAVVVACPVASPLTRLATDAGIGLISIEKRGLLDFRAVAKLVSLFTSGKLDVVHTHNGRTALLAAIAVTLARRGKVVSTQHFIEPAHATRRGLGAFLSRIAHRWVQSHTSRIIAISQAVEELMLARDRRLVGKIARVPNGIADPDRRLLRPAQLVREELGVSRNAPLVVCLARLEQEKNVADLITAMTHVARENPDTRCIIAGEGSQRIALQERINQAKLKDVVLLPGFQKDALSLIQAADVFVLPSHAEPFGLVLLEAMALAKPAIAVRAGGPREIVADGETGILVEPGDSRELGIAIVRLLGDPALRAKMGELGRRRFLESYHANRMAQSIVTVYSEALED